MTLKQTILSSLLVVAVVDLLQFGSDWRQSSIHHELPFAHNATALADTARSAASPAAATVTLAAANSTRTASPAEQAAARLTMAGLNPTYAQLYLDAAARTGTPWELIAAVHAVESHQRGDTNVTSSVGAVGPFQFLPATWRHYALDGNADGATTITSVTDSAFSAGNYLAANGAATSHYRAALFAYNHSNAYVSRVLSLAVKLGL